MSRKQLVQHLFQYGLSADQVLAQLPKNLTLSLIDGVLCLYDLKTPQSKLKVDFSLGPLRYRSQQHLGAENLVKACQIKAQEQVTVLDGTCGMGTDSFLLHLAGFQVTSVEKNIINYALLRDGIARYKQHSDESCFELLLADATDQIHTTYHDVIYLDPMFPNKIKSAKNKKTMQLFQSIHETETDNASVLLQEALKSKSKRVVIKRPTKSPLLTNFKPTFQVTGKTCRFDAYQLK